jgi:hypothetical protein
LRDELNRLLDGLQTSGVNKAISQQAAQNTIFSALSSAKAGNQVVLNDNIKAALSTIGSMSKDDFGSGVEYSRAYYGSYHAIQQLSNILEGSKLPSFAVGTDYVPRDMIAQIHEGERIVPKAYNPIANGGNDDLMKELIAEVKSLRLEVEAGNGKIETNTRKTRNGIELQNRYNRVTG